MKIKLRTTEDLRLIPLLFPGGFIKSIDNKFFWIFSTQQKDLNKLFDLI